MLRSKYRLGSVLLIGAIAVLILITSCANPVIAVDRIFLDMSLDFLGEYQLPKMSFLDTPVGGLSAITYDRRRDRFYALCDDPRFAPARFYTLKLALNSTDLEKIGIQKIDFENVTFLADKDDQTYPKGAIAPKGIVVTPQKTVFISGVGVTPDRVVPFVQEFDINSGQMLQSLPIPDRYVPDTADKSELTRGVQETSAFASLTLNPTGTIPASGEAIRLFTATESALVQDLDSPSS